MTYAVPKIPTRRRTHAHTVDIAGTAWPVYKVEALVLGLLVFVGALALTTSLQVAVLGAAAATVVAWWILKIREFYAQS
jgi:Flp pilus assembly protein TadB